MFKALGHRYNLDWVGLRYMNAYGPRQDYKGAYTAVMMKILDRIDQGLPPIVYGDGSQQYDFIYVGDIAQANVCAMQADVTGKNYNVGRGIGTSIKALTELLLRLTGSGLEIQYEPAGQTFVTNRIGSTQAAEQDLGFRWRVDIEDGMRRLIEWREADKKAVLLLKDETTPYQIPITKPFFGAEEEAAILAPLHSGWVVQGPYVKEFEEKFSAFTDSRFSIATSSCTTRCTSLSLR